MVVTASIPSRTLATVWLALFVDLVGFGMILPVLPFYATAYGASPAQVALLSTSFSLAQFVMSPVLGRISDRFGRRPVMLISIAGSCAAMVLLASAHSLWLIFAARVVSGMGNANISTAHAYVADRVPAQERARYMGMMGAATGLGFVMGPVLGGLLFTPDRPQLPFLVAAVLAATNWAMAWKWLPESRGPGAQDASAVSAAQHWRGWTMDLRGLLSSQLGSLVLVNFAFFFAFAAMESTFALFTEARLGWGARETGYMFTGIGVTIVITQGVIVGRLVAAIGEKATMLIGFVMLCVAFSMLAFATTTIAVAGSGVMMAAGNGLVMPSINALVSRCSTEHRQGLSLGVSASAGSLARITGPVVLGRLFELRGEGVPMLMAAITAFLAILWSLLRIRRPPEPHQHDG